MRKEINADLCHDLLIEKIVPKFSFSKDKDLKEFKKDLREKFISLTGLDEIEKNACPLNVQIEEKVACDGYLRIRFTFESEVGSVVPCYLLLPDTDKERYPVAITLQGHSTGFHLSIGEKKFERDEKYVDRGDFAVQAVKRGYAALAVEQRGFGERKSSNPWRLSNDNCYWNSRRALFLGRTTIGERVWDISRAIDALSFFPQCDVEKILITGNSGGGTASFYAACYDERIQFSAPSCSFCPYSPSILGVGHCECNYIPSAMKYFDMDDLAVLIAPRRLLIVTGKEDEIFPIEGVRNGYKKVKEIYRAVHAENNCFLVETEKGHYWCKDIVWDKIDEVVKGLEW